MCVCVCARAGVHGRSGNSSFFPFSFLISAAASQASVCKPLRVARCTTTTAKATVTGICIVRDGVELFVEMQSFNYCMINPPHTGNVFGCCHRPPRATAAAAAAGTVRDIARAVARRAVSAATLGHRHGHFGAARPTSAPLQHPILLLLLLLGRSCCTPAMLPPSAAAALIVVANGRCRCSSCRGCSRSLSSAGGSFHRRG